MTLKIKNIEFRLIQTNYKYTTVEDNTEILSQNESTSRYNYFLIMRHNPEFRHDKLFIEAYNNRYYKNFNQTFYEDDIINELTYDNIKKKVLEILTHKFPEFDDFNKNIRRYDPIILAENTFMSLFTFDALEDDTKKVMSIIDEISNELTKKYQISFKFDKKIEKVKNNKVILNGPKVSDLFDILMSQAREKKQSLKF